LAAWQFWEEIENCIGGLYISVRRVLHRFNAEWFFRGVSSVRAFTLTALWVLIGFKLMRDRQWTVLDPKLGDVPLLRV
jgi:hypothetical protein